MGKERLPHQLLFGELEARKRPQSKPPKRWKDCIKVDLTCRSFKYRQAHGVQHARPREVDKEDTGWLELLQIQLASTTRKKLSTPRHQTASYAQTSLLRNHRDRTHYSNQNNDHNHNQSPTQLRTNVRSQDASQHSITARGLSLHRTQIHDPQS